MLDEIKTLNELPKDGDKVLLVKFGWKAPCQKFFNNTRKVASRNSEIPFYWIEFNDEVKKELGITMMPSLVFYKGEKVTGSLSGHFWGHFQIENEMIERLK